MFDAINNYINEIIRSKKIRIKGKDAQWKKVKELKKGTKIAVLDNNDIFFDEIVSIKQLPPERVFDIEVEGTHNFVANKILAHNTYISDKIGIGTTSPAGKFVVSNSGSALTGQALAILNQYENQDLLTASASGVTKFTLDKNGSVMLGSIPTEQGSAHNAVCYEAVTINGATLQQLVNCSGAPADLAEYYPVEAALPAEAIAEAGDIVSIGNPLIYGSAKAFMVEKSKTSYDSKMLGVVSTKAWSVMGKDIFEWSDHNVTVAMVGRVPVKISNNSSEIKPGDMLTSSDESGKAQRADRDGYTIGKALEAWKPNNNQSTILVYLNNSVKFDSVIASSSEAILKNEFDEATISGTLTVMGKTNVSDLGITGKVIAGLLVINDGEMASISSLATPLKIQSNMSAPIEFMAGAVIIDVKGNLNITKGVILGNDSIRGINLKVEEGKTNYEVVFSTPRSSNNYAVVATPSWLTNTSINNKTNTGFEVVFSSPAPSTATLDWIIID